MSKSSTFTCLHCNAEFITIKWNDRDRRKYCSIKCFWALRNKAKETEIACAVCEKRFIATQAHVLRLKRYYCSAECHAALKKQNKNPRLVTLWTCATCGREYKPGILRCSSCDHKRLHRKYKDIVLDHYGRQCQCCGEIHIEFLSLDHKNGDGAEHRRQFYREHGHKLEGSLFYRWLIANQFPDNFQTLCMNCNAAKGWHGRCPHEDSRTT